MADDKLQIEDQQEKISSLEDKILDLEKKLEDTVYKLERHKHSGKDTADISNILSERLGIKISTIVGAAESINIDFAGVLQSSGRAAVGYLRLNALLGQYFGIEWSGGGEPYFTFSTDLIPAHANNAAAVAGGLIVGQVYRTNGDPDTLCIVH